MSNVRKHFYLVRIYKDDMKALRIISCTVSILLTAHLACAQNLGLDFTLGNSGVVLDSSATSGFKYANDVLLQPDGKILTVGNVASRYLPNGSLDNSFGQNGTVNSVGGSKCLLQTDGKILLIGAYGSNPVVTRLLNDGSLDPTFGINGTATGMVQNFYSDAVGALQPDGKIVVSGIVNQYDVGLWRIKSNGQVDSSFGINGVVVTSNGNYTGNVAGIKIMPDGKIVIGGIGYNPQVFRSVMVMRLKPNGTFDSTLGGTGKIYPIIEDYCRDIKVQGDGKILLPIGGLGADATILRLETDGSIDSAFGINGFADVPNMRIFSLQIAPDGKLVCGGDDENDFVISRTKANGKGLDSTFGRNGRTSTNIGDNFDRIGGIVLQTDGKIIAAGRSEIDNWWSTTRLTLVRYLPNAPTIVQNLLRPNKLVSVFPNPAASSVQVDCTKLSVPGIAYQIHNLQGQTVKTGAASTSRFTIDITQLLPAPYILCLQYSGQTSTYSFIKQ